MPTAELSIRSGDKLFAVEAIAPFGGAEEMIKELKANVFPTKELRFVAVTKDGKKEVAAARPPQGRRTANSRPI